MAMSVVYATVNGRMVQENRGGTITRYVADTLGSVIQTRNASGVQTSSTTYWPYGEVRTSTGTNPSPWGFVGTLGYFRDALSRLYIRARYYIASIGRWNTVDPLWPEELAYGYAKREPIGQVDPSGTMPCQTPCNPRDCCDRFGNPAPKPCHDYLVPGEKPNQQLLKCLREAGENKKKIRACFDKYRGSFKQATCDYLGCLAGSNIPGGNSGLDPRCGRDDYPKCYQTYISALCKCHAKNNCWPPFALTKCLGKAYLDMVKCVANADPYDGN